MRREQRLAFGEDLARFVAPRSAPRGLRRAAKIIGEPGLTFAWLLRQQLSLESAGRLRAARALHLLNLRLTGGEIGHGSRVGGGLVVKHPLGVVIGGGTELGRCCTILHNVTLGELRPGDATSAGRYPRIGNNVTIGTGASVLGAIRIGDYATVGAGAVVVRDVDTATTVVGVPARPLALRVVEEGS